MNTYEKGTLRYVFIKENKSFLGVCLDLDILVEGDNFYSVKKELVEVSKNHIELVIKNKLPKKLLNRRAPKKYWDINNQILKSETDTKLSVVSPYQFINSKVILNA